VVLLPLNTGPCAPQLCLLTFINFHVTFFIISVSSPTRSPKSTFLLNLTPHLPHPIPLCHLPSPRYSLLFHLPLNLKSLDYTVSPLTNSMTLTHPYFPPQRLCLFVFPTITSIINHSLATGLFPTHFKDSFVSLRKNPSLDK
jgi:hypothetical protein